MLTGLQWAFLCLSSATHAQEFLSLLCKLRQHTNRKKKKWNSLSCVFRVFLFVCFTKFEMIGGKKELSKVKYKLIIAEAFTFLERAIGWCYPEPKVTVTLSQLSWRLGWLRKNPEACIHWLLLLSWLPPSLPPECCHHHYCHQGFHHHYCYCC